LGGLYRDSGLTTVCNGTGSERCLRRLDSPDERNNYYKTLVVVVVVSVVVVETSVTPATTTRAFYCTVATFRLFSSDDKVDQRPSVVGPLPPLM